MVNETGSKEYCGKWEDSNILSLKRKTQQLISHPKYWDQTVGIVLIYLKATVSL